MDIYSKAIELGSMIAESKEMAELKTAEDIFHNDEKARFLFNDYNLLQKELAKSLSEKRNNEIIDTINLRLEQKQEEINSYQVTKSYLAAKASFDGLMKKINDVMIFTITGESPCSSKSGDSCGDCKGCK